MNLRKLQYVHFTVRSSHDSVCGSLAHETVRHFLDVVGTVFKSTFYSLILLFNSGDYETLGWFAYMPRYLASYLFWQRDNFMLSWSVLTVNFSETAMKFDSLAIKTMRHFFFRGLCSDKKKVKLIWNLKSMGTYCRLHGPWVWFGMLCTLISILPSDLRSSQLSVPTSIMDMSMVISSWPRLVNPFDPYH